MDLANAPDLPRTSHASDLAQDRTDEVRLLSADDARQPNFLRAWGELAGKASEPNPFFEPWFLLPSLDAFSASERAPIKLFALYDLGALVGLLPFSGSIDYYGYPIPHKAAWLHDNAFCGAPLVKRGFERHFWESLLGELDRAPGAGLFLHVPALPLAGPLNQALMSLATKQDRPFFTVLETKRAMLQSDQSPSEYCETSLSTKKRKELRRQHKRLSEEGQLAFERCENGDDLDVWIAEFLALEAAGWKGEAGSALANSPDTRAFFSNTLAWAAEAGKLERLTLRLNGKPIAMLANFICPPGVYSFKTTFDEAFARYSPGMLLQLENLDLLDRRGIDWADSCAAEGHPMIERLWREKRTVQSHNIAIGGRVRSTLFRHLMAYETRKRTDK